MTSTERATGVLRLPVARLTALVGPEAERRRVSGGLGAPGGTARCADGHDVPGVRVVTAGRREDVATRLAALDRLADERPAVVVAERLTDGLGAAERRRVLAALRGIAEAGASVVVDDVDPVAALAAAHAVLRVAPGAALHVEAVDLDEDAWGQLAS